MNPGSAGSQLQLDPERLGRFLDLVGREKRKTVRMDRLREIFSETFPHRPPGPIERRWLIQALREGESRGLLQLPSRNGQSWDRSVDPPLPSWVRRVEPERRDGPPEWETFPWHPKLQWVSEMRSLSDKQLRFLQRVHKGLVRGHFDTPAPIRYRSLELLGEEKGLAQMRQTVLFADGRLSLELLGCVGDYPPVAWKSVAPNGGRALVFENAGAFHVAVDVLRSMTIPPYDVVVYGSGTSFQQGVRSLLDLDRPMSQIRYVGDLDPNGLRIAAGAARTAEDAGLPPLEVATELHTAMLATARQFGAPGGWPNGKQAQVDESALNILAPSIREAVREMLRCGRRIPEEVLGPEEMRAALED